MENVMADKNKVKSVFSQFEAKAYSADDPLPIKVADIINPDRVIRFRASDDTIDRSGEVIMVSGWDLSDWLKNPVVMQFHDYNSWPIGRGVGAGMMEDGLYIDAEFDPPEVDESADLVFRKIKHGTIKAGSVGFIPQDMVVKGSEKSKLPEFKQLFDKYVNASRIFLKQSLLEWTICPVPCNPNALAASLQKSLETRFGGESIQDAATDSIADSAAILTKLEELNKQLKKGE